MNNTVPAEREGTAVNRLAIRASLAVCALLLAVKVAIYLTDPARLFADAYLNILQFLLMLGALVGFGLYIRKQLGGWWTFTEAFKSYLMVLLLTTLMNAGVNALVLGVLKPALVHELPVKMRSEMTQLYRKANFSEADIKEKVKALDGAEDALRVTPQSFITGLGVNLAINGFIALVFAAIMKKREAWTYQ